MAVREIDTIFDKLEREGIIFIWPENIHGAFNVQAFGNTISLDRYDMWKLACSIADTMQNYEDDEAGVNYE